MFVFDQHIGLLLQTMYPGKVEVFNDRDAWWIGRWDVEGVEQPADLVKFFDDNVHVLTEGLAAQVRRIRLELLRDTDWVFLADVAEDVAPEKIDAYKAYRRALRDLPAQPGFPLEVEWPVAPT